MFGPWYNYLHGLNKLSAQPINIRSPKQWVQYSTDILFDDFLIHKAKTYGFNISASVLLLFIFSPIKINIIYVWLVYILRAFTMGGDHQGRFSIPITSAPAPSRRSMAWADGPIGPAWASIAEARADGGVDFPFFCFINYYFFIFFSYYKYLNLLTFISYTHILLYFCKTSVKKEVRQTIWDEGNNKILHTHKNRKKNYIKLSFKWDASLQWSLLRSKLT